MAHDFKNYPELTNTQLQTMRFESPHEQIEEDFVADVVKVHDGDTITLQTSFRDFNFPLRFLGIDAPEMNAGGETTRDWLKGKILGEQIQIIINKKNRVDKYGRLLGTAMFRGMDLGQEEIYLGLAKPFTSRYEGQLPNIDKELNIKKWF